MPAKNSLRRIFDVKKLLPKTITVQQRKLRRKFVKHLNYGASGGHIAVIYAEESKDALWIHIQILDDEDPDKVIPERLSIAKLTVIARLEA